MIMRFWGEKHMEEPAGTQNCFPLTNAFQGLYMEGPEQCGRHVGRKAELRGSGESQPCSQRGRAELAFTFLGLAWSAFRVYLMHWE